MINVYPLQTGYVGVDRAVAQRNVSKNPLAYTGILRCKKHREWLPVKTFYIDHPKGKILVDAGWDKLVRTDPDAAVSSIMKKISTPNLPEGQAVDERLEKLGVHPDDLDYVIMTHLDLDHTSGLPLVKDAKHFMADEREIEAYGSKDPRYMIKKPTEDISLETIPFKKDEGAPYGESWDVFDDGTVMVYRMPGHSKGSVVLKVQGKDGFVLIVGDTGYKNKSWKEILLPGPLSDADEMTRSLQWVARESQKPDCLGILSAHDPEENREVIQIEE